MTRDELAATLYAFMARHFIIFRVEDTEGAPLPLDGRALARARAAAFRYENWAAKDWIAAAEGEQYEAKRRREAAEADLWRYAAQDQTFCRLLSDYAAGLRIKHLVGGPLPESLPAEPTAPAA